MTTLRPRDLPRGFRFAAYACGLKAKGALDLALFYSEAPARAAAMFTRNLVRAAPLEVSREHLARAAEQARAVVVNSGNANCCTGREGFATARATAAAVARVLGIAQEQVLVASTGVIGVELPRANILSAIHPLAQSLASTPRALESAARAIMTTDTRPKLALARCRLGGKDVRVMGVAKGAGMIHPNLATMLGFIFTDAAVPRVWLRASLGHAVDCSFNLITVDGDTSTNDMVIVLANGEARNQSPHGRSKDALVFRDALTDVARSLAEQIARDGEGAGRLVRVEVTGAQDDKAARQIAKTIATSLLVKTALAGGDPNWGRILAAAGRSGISFDPLRADIELAGTLVYRQGRPLPFNEAAVSRRMRRPEVGIRVDLHQGGGACEVLTCDLTAEYIHVNADYRT